MKSVLSILFLPIVLFSSLRDTYLEDMASSLITNDFSLTEEILDEWEEMLCMDSSAINICRSFLLLKDGALTESKELFEKNFEIGLVFHPHKESVKKFFYKTIAGIEDGSLTLYASNVNGADIILCARGWKIKAVVGAVLIGVGSVVTPFNPAIGVGLITTGGNLIADGTLTMMDEENDRKQREIELREREISSTNLSI